MSARIALASSQSKGGPRHKPSPVVDPSILAAVFAKHKESIANFIIYEHISVSQAVRGNGLVQHYNFLKTMLTLCPSGDMPGTSAKAAMLTLVVQCPEINTSIYNSSVWAGMRCERIGCMLNHLRRLAREPDRLKQAALSMSGQDLAKLKTLINMLQLGVDGSLSSGLASGACSDDDATIEGVEAREVEVVPRKRLLTKTPSDASQVSVDSQGFPSILQLSKPAVKDKCCSSSQAPAAKKPKPMISEDVEVDEDGFPICLVESKAKRTPLKEKSPGPGSALRNPLRETPPRPVVSPGPVASPSPAASPVPGSGGEKTWTKMWYKSPGSVGIRRGKGHSDKAQIFSLSNRDWSEDEIKALGSQCLDKLHAGVEEATVYAWAQAELGKV